MNEFDDEFKKIYVFKASGQCTLPKKIFESPKWEIRELQLKKQELNKVKSSLSKYNLKVWRKHTANRDRAGFVMTHLSENIRPELLTQAWCKFYEILSQFPVVPLCAISQHKLVSLHLCEAPGAFVCALNHYLTLNYPGLEWSWKASTLNPNYEGNSLSQMIPDDRFIKHTISKWNFGADFSGDITKFYNHEDFVLFFRKNNIKVSLVTADGSVDCMNNPGEQERQVERLHFCETMTALSVLQKGGAFVLKIFTIFEETTINLLFLLNCLFEKVSVFKPCCSKGGNSEVYVVSTNFKE
nr:cap-specific mRNA (nucleoside-2'-O-)-methyltransferase 2 [Leptinotarsa decemlineata]